MTLSSAELYFKSIHILYLSAAPRIYLFDADFRRLLMINNEIFFMMEEVGNY